MSLITSDSFTINLLRLKLCGKNDHKWKKVTNKVYKQITKRTLLLWTLLHHHFRSVSKIAQMLHEPHFNINLNTNFFHVKYCLILKSTMEFMQIIKRLNLHTTRKTAKLIRIVWHVWWVKINSFMYLTHSCVSNKIRLIRHGPSYVFRNHLKHSLCFIRSLSCVSIL